MLYTVGYEGRAIEDFVALLQRYEVDQLIDVRYRPSSRKPGFSKTRLSETLADLGIEYRHIRELGVPAERRPAFRRGQASALDAYRSRIASEEEDAIQAVMKAASEGRAVLLCLERDASACHRHIIAELVHKRAPTITVDHLD